MHSILVARGSLAGAVSRSGRQLRPSRHPLTRGDRHLLLLPPRCCISTSPPALSSPQSFHGLPLPDDKTPPPQPKIREAEVVQSEDDKQRNKELIKEAIRAEMSAHSIAPKNDEAGGVEGKHRLDPYERRLQRLKYAIGRHQNIDRQGTAAYAQSCMELGELHYQLGHMEDSQEHYVTALEELLGGDGEKEAHRTQMMIAQSMNVLGAIHARCRDYDESSRWYEESLKRKQKIIDDGDVASTALRIELGKTYNGMAALEVMRGGDAQKAMSLFQEAERSYLHGYDLEVDEKGAVLEETPSPSATLTKESIQEMTASHIESIINVRSNMGELFRQRGQHDAAIKTIQMALSMARMALENEYESEVTDTIDQADGPSPDEQRNAIVDLQVKIADTLISAKRFDEAAEAYEQALGLHVFFRRCSKDDGVEQHPSEQTTVLPATTTTPDIKLDLSAATTIEAAIRNNLAHALAQIGQDKLSLAQYEASLSITRRIGGDSHLEVGRTLMGMGALLGGPMRDLTKALNCFKEALYIYRTNLEDLTDGKGENELSGFYSGEDGEELNRHIENASKNISLIEAALLKDNDGASRRKRA